MLPRPFAALPALALLLAAASAAPVPKGPETPEYFPAKLGARWVIQVTAGGPADNQVSEHTDVVVKVEEKGVVKLVTVSRDGGRPTSHYAVSPSGVSRVRQNEFVFDPPLQLLRLPSRPGDEWAWDSVVTSPLPPARFTGRSQAFGPEWVEVPAGRYHAVRVETEYSDGGSDHSQVCWYAPGVGLVKGVSRSPGFKSETVLKSFAPSKD